MEEKKYTAIAVAAGAVLSIVALSYILVSVSGLAANDGRRRSEHAHIVLLHNLKRSRSNTKQGVSANGTAVSAADIELSAEDAAKLLAKYRDERDRRLRKEGNQQYIEINSVHTKNYLEDP